MSQAPDYVDLFEQAPAGYMLLDAAGNIETINHTGAEMLGWEQSWLTGKPFSRWVAQNDRPLLHAHLQRLRGSEQRSSQELRVKNRQGRFIDLRLTSVAADGRSGTAGSRTLMVDISGEERSARKLRHLQSSLEHVARLNTAGELASSLAHELNQPLGTVMLNCEAALRLLNEDSRENYEFAEALGQAIEAASFASEVIRHLRGFLRKNGESHQVCTLPTLVRDVTTLIAMDARDNDVELLLDIEGNLPEICVDPVQIEQVLMNLAHNSIEAMSQRDVRSPNRVVVRVRREPPNQILVSVEDTGPGLEGAGFDRIFSPFYTTKDHGMGMGLSISRGIVQAHGGRLWAAATAGGGATMHFTLPVNEGPADAD